MCSIGTATTIDEKHPQNRMVLGMFLLRNKLEFVKRNSACGRVTFGMAQKSPKSRLGCPRGGLRLRCASSRSPMMDTPRPPFTGKFRTLMIEIRFVWCKSCPCRPILLLDSGVTPYLGKNLVFFTFSSDINPVFDQVGRSPAQGIQRVGEESLPQRKLYFNDNVSENGGPGRSPGELWVLSFSGKYLAPEREISLQIPVW